MSSFSSKAKGLWLRTVRLYTYNFPFDKGKYRLFTMAMRVPGDMPGRSEVDTKDGRKFSVNFNTGMQSTVFFLGQYEKPITEIITPLIEKGDICLDVGANFGWYTTLFHLHSGEKGEVHSFEPMLPTFQELTRNYKLMCEPENVYINNLALGDKADEIEIYMFPELNTGHASISKQKAEKFETYKCRMITLDSYIEEKNVGDVNFVKMDIEGAELMFLKGAQLLFKQEIPPIWLIEMALQQTKSFGYLPNDLIEFMRERANYDFYKIDEFKTKLIKIEGFEKDDIGANVICFPRNHYKERFEKLKKFI